MRELTLSLVVIGALALPLTQAGAVDITECGQTVPPRQVGNLVGDLDCTDPNQFDWYAVWLERQATLNLNGFSLFGPEGLRLHEGVHCRSRSKCRVNGPGAILGFNYGIHGYLGHVRLTDVTVSGADGRGIQADSVFGTGCTVSETGDQGIIADRIKLSDSSVSDTGSTGIAAGGGKVSLRNVTVTGNASNGISAKKAVLRNVTVTGNMGNGIRVMEKMRALDSEIVGNSIDCPEAACYDIWVSRAGGRALLRNTTYGTCGPGGGCRSR